MIRKTVKLALIMTGFMLTTTVAMDQHSQERASRSVLGKSVYAFGKDDEQDLARNFELYRRAATQEQNRDAQFNLGRCFRKGLGVQADPKEAFKWYEAAAEQDHDVALFYVGICFDEGQGVDKDHVQAAINFEKSANLGVWLAKFNLAIILYHGAEGVPEDKARASILFKELAPTLKNLAKGGNSEARYILSKLHIIGEGVKLNPKRAVRLLEKAIDDGHIDARVCLGDILSSGVYTDEGIPIDYERAVKLYQEAADNGNIDAKCRYALMLAYGSGVQQDEVTAKQILQELIDTGVDCAAKRYLARIIEAQDQTDQNKTE